jgi:cytochrome P450
VAGTEVGTASEFSPETQHVKMYEIMTQTYADPGQVAARASGEPQGMYADLLAAGPVRAINDYFSLQTRADIAFVNKHPAVEQGVKFLGSDRPAIPLGLDGPDHRKFRKLLDPVFTAKRVEPLTDEVRALANELIDGFIGNGEVDAYAAYCEPLPSLIFLGIMGLPTADLPQFLHFKSLALANEGPTSDMSEEAFVNRRVEAVTWLHAYFDRDLDAREREGAARDDMIGWLLEAEVEGQRLTREEMHDVLGLFMVAGLDTVAASLSCQLSYLARHPEDRARLVAEPALIPRAIEELMRWETPVVDAFRITRSDLELPSGTQVPAGSWLHLSWASANLDPAAFDRPMEVDLTRHPNPHIAFANGFHRCLGSHLARLEMRVALEAWHERIPQYGIPEGAELAYTGNPRAPHRLPIAW